MGKWNQELFLEKINEIIQKECDGVQARFNEKIGIRDAVTRWRGGIVPKAKTIERISESFPGYPADWFYENHTYISESGASYQLSADDHNIMQTIMQLNKSQKIELLTQVIDIIKKEK